MSETTEFPLPADVTPEERDTARREIGKYSTIRDDDARSIRFDGRQLGQTGPIWHFQYTRIFEVPKGFIVAAHDLREGIVVVHSERAEDLPEKFSESVVREFLEDELRFRGVVGNGHAAAEQPRA
ncbi:MAG TPA: hypothetical protein VFM93_08870 [Candidatus Limnocylindria bacterium]|nr:hypothetical protein [Candidatus Limnocylindria bacterium]